MSDQSASAEEAFDALIGFRNFVTLGGVVHPKEYQRALDSFESAVAYLRSVVEAGDVSKS